MKTITMQDVKVAVNVFEKSVTYQVTALFQLMFRIARARGLPSKYMCLIY